MVSFIFSILLMDHSIGKCIRIFKFMKKLEWILVVVVDNLGVLGFYKTYQLEGRVGKIRT